MNYLARIAAFGFLTASAWPAMAIVIVTPPTVSQYVFTGLCTDCLNADSTPGIGRGTLTLQNYTPGAALANANFLSFAYTSPWLAYTMNEVEFLSGVLNTVPGTSSVAMFGAATGAYSSLYPFSDPDPSMTPFIFFSEESTGTWSTGPGFVVIIGEPGGEPGGGAINDFGTRAAWAPAVPEPAFAGVVCGLAACMAGIRRYRMRRAAANL